MGSLLCVGCGGADPAIESAAGETLAFVGEGTNTSPTSTTLIAAAPDVRLSAADTAFVRFEAAWICELQRRTFASQDGRELAMVEKLGDFGLDPAGYQEFRSRVNEDQELRDSILFGYQETCRP